MVILNDFVFKLVIIYSKENMKVTDIQMVALILTSCLSVPGASHLASHTFQCDFCTKLATYGCNDSKKTHRSKGRWSEI